MDLTFTVEEERFRLELRQWLREHLPPGWGTLGYAYPRTYENGSISEIPAKDAGRVSERTHLTSTAP